MRKTILIILGFFFLAANLYADSNWDEMRDYAKQKDYVSAEKYIKGAIQERYKDEDVYMLAGEIYTELGKYEEA